MFPFGIPVSPIEASQEWLDRVDENSEHLRTPEGRLLLSFPRKLNRWMTPGMAILRMGGKLFILDERTKEEKAADKARFSTPLSPLSGETKQVYDEASTISDEAYNEWRRIEAEGANAVKE